MSSVTTIKKEVAAYFADTSNTKRETISGLTEILEDVKDKIYALKGGE